MKYKMEALCDNCPFMEEGAGLQLRLSLGKARWNGIKSDLVKGLHFLCHKTTNDGEWVEDGNGEEQYVKGGGEKICAGSRFYQQKLGIVSDAEQIMERVLSMKNDKT